MDNFTSWAMQKADEIVMRQKGLKHGEIRPGSDASHLRDAILEALIEAYGLGQEPIGDD